MNTNTYQHHGVQIIFDPTRAQFSATLGSGIVRAPSLDAMKKKIDKAKEAEAKFSPFKAITVRGYYRLSGDPTSKPEPLEFYDVVRIEKGRNKRHRYGQTSFEFVTANHGGRGDRTEAVVVKDSPKARLAVEHYHTVLAQAEREMATLEAKVEAARAKIPWLKIEDFVKEQGA